VFICELYNAKIKVGIQGTLLYCTSEQDEVEIVESAGPGNAVTGGNAIKINATSPTDSTFTPPDDLSSPSGLLQYVTVRCVRGGLL
jgi:hypothetical protein